MVGARPWLSAHQIADAMTSRSFYLRWLLSLSILLAAALSFSAQAGSTRLLESDSFAQVRARYAHKPLVVHIWGLTCGPCLEELPSWGKLKKAHPDMNLVLIQADDAPIDAVGSALDHAGLGRVESWSVPSELDEFARARIDPSWSGEMPRTLLISADGSITTIRGMVDPAVITRWLAPR
jgi:thiol-disulfide isomerase/thioredoxin